jgi:hypothetical protein
MNQRIGEAKWFVERSLEDAVWANTQAAKARCLLVSDEPCGGEGEAGPFEAQGKLKPRLYSPIL